MENTPEGKGIGRCGAHKETVIEIFLSELDLNTYMYGYS